MAEEVQKSLRYRVNVSILARGHKVWDCTAEGVGYTREEVLAESDALVRDMEARYPAPREA